MKNNELNNRKTRSIETKNKIYHTANQLFKEFGYDNVSVDLIVEKAGVSKGAFYVHFDSKDSLTALLLNDIVNEVDIDYRSYVESLEKNLSPSQILISLIGKIADILINTIGYAHMSTVYKVQLTKSVNMEAVMGYNRELYKIFNDIISRGVNEGHFIADIPADSLAKHFIMAIRGLTYEWCIRYPGFDLKKEADTHFKILINGIIENKANKIYIF